MSDFRFAEPNWIHGLCLVMILIVALIWFEWRRGELLARFVSVIMQTRLAIQLSNSRRWLRIGALTVSSIALVIALMRPQYGLTFQETPRVGAQIMFCLDV